MDLRLLWRQLVEAWNAPTTLDVLRRSYVSGLFNYYRANFSGERPVEWTDPPMVDVPTLMIWGEEDAALGKELTFGTEDLVTDFTLRYLPQVSHWVQQEAPETVNAMIRAWIEGRYVPQAGLGGRLLIAES